MTFFWSDSTYAILCPKIILLNMAIACRHEDIYSQNYFLFDYEWAKKPSYNNRLFYGIAFFNCCFALDLKIAHELFFSKLEVTKNRRSEAIIFTFNYHYYVLENCFRGNICLFKASFLLEILNGYKNVVRPKAIPNSIFYF